jgi:hypothetical protein
LRITLAHVGQRQFMRAHDMECMVNREAGM